MRNLILFLAATFQLCVSLQAFAATIYEGSHRPYPVPSSITEYPDSLQPFYISHVGRHGSRYPSSASNAKYINFYLDYADTTNTITRAGRQMMEIADNIIRLGAGKWGDLDSIGIEEQRGIAERMYAKYPALFENTTIEAISTYSPRAIMSMYSFTHRLAQLSGNVEIATSAGDRHSAVLRPFDNNEKYMAFRNDTTWKNIYDQYYKTECPVSVARRLVNEDFDVSEDALRELSTCVYSLIAGMSSMGIDFDYTPFMSDEEYENLWSIDNLHHYLLYSASTVSTIPAELAIPLIEQIVEDADRVIDGKKPVAANLRFAHAETLMPLLSLLQIENCYYITHYFDQVKLNWQDYNIVPMAANLQFVFFKTDKGNIYVRTDLNETPVHLIPGNDNLYLPWHTVRDYLLNFILVID